MKLLTAVLSTLLLVSSAQAQVAIGAKGFARVPMCEKEKDMVAVAKADSAGGPEKAMELLQTLAPDCGIGVAEMLILRRVAHFPLARGGNVSVLEVEVELSDGTKQKVYIITDGAVTGIVNT